MHMLTTPHQPGSRSGFGGVTIFSGSPPFWLEGGLVASGVGEQLIRVQMRTAARMGAATHPRQEK
jgi:hypothetical protein